MKHKKWKWNYYIVSFVIFIFILIFIDLYMNGIVAEYFVRTLLDDREEVVLNYSGYHAIRGTFRWDRLRDILTFLSIAVFLTIEVTIYFIIKISRNHEGEKRKTILYEKEKIEQEKEIEIQKKNDLVTYLAHDLKTPLTSIIGYLNILEESEVPKEIRKDYVKRVLDKAYHLEDLTNQFFDITRFNLQEIPLNKTEIDGEFFLHQITDELYPLFIPKKLQIELAIVPNLKIYGDGTLLARVLNNLLKNAISYSRTDSIIKVTATEQPETTIITVENDGDIISPQELKLIFQKFYRRDKARSQSSGAGLGLAIAKEIIERHNGTLNAESLNGHTTFTIHLPKSL